jgi:hypothetical protein
VKAGDVVSYQDICSLEGLSLQRGMNYRVHGRKTIVLMSLRKGAPYGDRVEDEGRVLIYEGHDVPRHLASVDPKAVDQCDRTPRGGLTENGKFFEAAMRFKKTRQGEYVRVYEKIKDGIWTYNGEFLLTDSWVESDGNRNVFKFRLELVVKNNADLSPSLEDPRRDRVIPSAVKLELWRRDQGKCRRCGRTDNLHFDHIIPFSRGGSSLVAENVQLLCARHNLAKRDRII